MADGMSTPPPKSHRGNKRRSNKPQEIQQVPHDASSYAQYEHEQQQSGQCHQPVGAHPGASPQYPHTAGLPSTTPSRKRQGQHSKPNSSRNGYHSDTGTTHYGQQPRHQPNSQSIDISNGAAYGTASPGTLTPSKQQVYAGPTFLASPAASSLPMPKAFSRAGQPASLHESESEPNETPLRSPGLIQPSQQRRGSPLDMLFNADRAEKSRKASEGAPSPLSRLHSASREHAGSARGVPHQPQRGATPSGTSNKEIFMMEMDGHSDQSDNEESSKSLPFKERIQAISQSGANAHKAPPSHDDEDLRRQAKTRALKQLLMGPDSDPVTRAPSVPHSAPPHAVFQAPNAPYRASALDEPPPRQPPVTSPNPQDLRAMEENLRKVLKLGPGPS